MPGPNLSAQDAKVAGSGPLGVGAAAGTTVATSLIDLGESAFAQFFPQRVSFQLQAPLLSSTQLPNSTNIAYAIFTSDAATTNAASAQELISIPAAGDGNINSTSTSNFALGASSGSSAFNYTFGPPPNARRYLWGQAVCSASTNANSATFALVALF